MLNTQQLLVQMISLKKEIKIELFRIAHESGFDLEEYIEANRVPHFVWVDHTAFAVLHEEYCALKEGIRALAK